MGLFKKRKKLKQTQEPDLIISSPSREVLDSALNILTRVRGEKRQIECPDIMNATQACYCIGCSKVNICQVEKMSRGSGCVHFTTYCSLRDSLKNKPTLDWANVALRQIMRAIHDKYGTDEITMKNEDDYGEKKGKGIPISGELSGYSEEVE